MTLHADITHPFALVVLLETRETAHPIVPILSDAGSDCGRGIHGVRPRVHVRDVEARSGPSPWRRRWWQHWLWSVSIRNRRWRPRCRGACCRDGSSSGGRRRAHPGDPAGSRRAGGAGLAPNIRARRARSRTRRNSLGRCPLEFRGGLEPERRIIQIQRRHRTATRANLSKGGRTHDNGHQQSALPGLSDPPDNVMAAAENATPRSGNTRIPMGPGQPEISSMTHKLQLIISVCRGRPQLGTEIHWNHGKGQA